MAERPFFVVNPQSAGGKTGGLWESEIWPSIQVQFPDARWGFTGAEGHGARLAEHAWHEGADLVIAVGGDGSINEVVNGLMGHLLEAGDQPLSEARGPQWPRPAVTPPRPALGVLPQGTGCDLIRSLAIPRDLDGALELLAGGRRVRADVGELCFTRRGGQSTDKRYFFNISGGGANGEVVDRVNRSSKRLGGFLTFLLATVATQLRYFSPRVEIAVDDAAPRSVDLAVLFVCNAQYCGGGMRVGKGAFVNDGKFQVVELASVGRLKSFVHGSKLYSGRLGSIPGARVYPARKIEVKSSSEVLIDCDGEQPGIFPATFSMHEGALEVLAGPDALAVVG